MNFGFVIDNRSCIGCHACSTACKSENQVPLGVYRTWVKYTETGTYPHTQRHFQVTRCNHCSNPPCVRICPTQAMYQRDDGIVEFDKDACIGCKACMQACPYDAIHIDPETHTAAKCHYCAHRVEVGLEPSCVVVCPTHAILAGDIDDPESEISRVLAREKVSVRKPEQGTAPKLFYIDGAAVSLVPTPAEAPAESFVWADRVAGASRAGGMGEARGLRSTTGAASDREPGTKRSAVPRGSGVPPTGHLKQNRAGVALRAPQPQGLPSTGPLQLGRRMASHMVQVGYNAQHQVPWHWPVPAYLVTKGIASGAFLLLAVLFGLGVVPFAPALAVAGGAIVVAGLLATTALLVYDLERPTRFLKILLRPQWRSWLARGAVFLIGMSTVASAWTALELAASLGWVPAHLAAAARPWLLWGGTPLAIGAAVYTAFLFGQAEGRDLWQSSLLPLHLLIQAAIAGSAALLVTAAFVPVPAGLVPILRATLGAALAIDLFAIFFGELGMSHASEVAARAAHDITHGRYRHTFWWGAVALGHAVPLALLLLPAAAAPLAAAASSALAGLYFYEHAFVMAPQRVPNS